MNFRRILSVALTGVLLTGSLFFIPAAARAQGQSQAQPSTAVLAKPFIKVTFPSVNVVWEKGKSYTVRWESRGIVGNVRIRLVSANRQVFELVGNVPNNGTHDCYVGPNLYSGVYKIQVMKMDYSVTGESAATVTIGPPKTTSPKVTAQAQPGKTPTPGKPMTKTGAATVAGRAGVTSTGGTHATGATAAAGTTASASSSRTGTATAAGTAKMTMQVVRVSEAELKSAKLIPGAGPSSTANRMTSLKNLQGEILVISPGDGDEWYANQDYTINWRSTNITDDIRIVLEPTMVPGGGPTNQQYTIADRIHNVGSYLFHLPQNLSQRPGGHRVRVETWDGKTSGKSAGFIRVYTQNVDLECKIVDAHTGVETDWYVVYAKQQHWFQYNVLMRNNGTQSPVNIPDVLVRIIKEPEEIVCDQEEWGFAGIYRGGWYKLNEPRRFDTSSWQKVWGVNIDKTVNLTRGGYRVEIELDPQNLLGENQLFRQDNKAVQEWEIR